MKPGQDVKGLVTGQVTGTKHQPSSVVTPSSNSVLFCSQTNPQRRGLTLTREQMLEGRRRCSARPTRSPGQRKRLILGFIAGSQRSVGGGGDGKVCKRRGRWGDRTETNSHPTFGCLNSRLAFSFYFQFVYGTSASQMV